MLAPIHGIGKIDWRMRELRLVESSCTIVVEKCGRQLSKRFGFLEKDWEEDRLPMDLVEEAGLLGAICTTISCSTNVKGGYCKMDQRIVFVVEPSRLHSNPSRENLLAGINGWETAIGGIDGN